MAAKKNKDQQARDRKGKASEASGKVEATPAEVGAGHDADTGGKRAPKHMRTDAMGTDGRKPKRKHKTVKIVIAVIAVVAMVLASGMGIYGLFVGAEDAANQSWKKSGKVAATVMGDNVMEDTITSQIMSARGNKSDADWAQYLVDNDETPSGLRSEAISSYKSDIILRHAMIDKGLSYTLRQSDVDRWWDAEGDAYKQYGIDKDTAKSYYASSIRQWLLEQKVVPKKTITDKDVLAYLNKNADKYNGARKSSHILFALDDSGKTDNKEKAESVLKKIKDGDVTFEDAASKYSTDSASASDKGNVGWDCDSSFVDVYEKALKGLDKGEITDTVVKSTYGYHIIKCTGVLKWNGKLRDIGIVPKDIVDSVRKTLQSERFQKWYDDYESDANVKINDMPRGLPYDVSLAGVTKSKNANGSSSVSVTSTDENGNVVSADGDNGTSDGTGNAEKTTGNASAKSGKGKAGTNANAE